MVGLCQNVANVGPVALACLGADRGSVAFALRCRRLRARSGPADGCRGRGRRCRSRFQRFRCARRSAVHRREKAEAKDEKKPKDEPGGTNTKDGSLGSGGQSGQQHSTGAKKPKDEPGGTNTKDGTKDDSDLGAAVSDPVAATPNEVAPVSVAVTPASGPVAAVPNAVAPVSVAVTPVSDPVAAVPNAVAPVSVAVTPVL